MYTNLDLLKTALFYLVVIFIGLYLYQVLVRRIYRHPPGPFKIPLLGNLVQIMLADEKHHYKGLYKLSKKYGSIMTSDIGMVPAVTINGYEAIKSVYSNDNFLNRLDSDWMLHRSFGKKIGLSSGSTEFWTPTRKFTTKYLRDFGYEKRNIQQTLLEEETVDLSQDIEETIAKSGGILEPCTIFKIPVLNAIWASVTNSRFSHRDPSVLKLLDLNTEYFETLKVYEGAPAAFPGLVKWLPQLFSNKKLFEVDDRSHDFLREMVTKIEQANESKDEPTCFVESYLCKIKTERLKGSSSDKLFNEETLISVIYDLFTGGGYTTSEAMRFAIFWLTLYPECQDKIRAEIEKVAGQKEFVPFEDKEKLPYTLAFIWETLRRNIPVPISPRKVYKDTPLENFIIPANTAIILNTYSITMDEDFWGDPQNFRPSRFLDDQNNIINSERVLVFGAGKRDCIGRSIAFHALFAFITYLVRKYEFLPLKAGYPYDVNNLKPGTLIALAKFGIRVKKL